MRCKRLLCATAVATFLFSNAAFASEMSVPGYYDHGTVQITKDYSAYKTTIKTDSGWEFNTKRQYNLNTDQTAKALMAGFTGGAMWVEMAHHRHENPTPEMELTYELVKPEQGCTVSEDLTFVDFNVPLALKAVEKYGYTAEDLQDFNKEITDDVDKMLEEGNVCIAKNQYDVNNRHWDVYIYRALPSAENPEDKICESAISVDDNGTTFLMALESTETTAGRDEMTRYNDVVESMECIISSIHPVG